MRIVNEIAHEDFTVVDSSLAPVLGLDDGEFVEKLYNPSSDEVSSIVFVAIVELGNGNYRASFTPNVVGDWYLVITHSTYFPWGKAATIDVTAAGIEVLGNKKVLIQVSENEYTEKWYAKDNATVIREFKITKAGNTETRDPV